MDFAGAEYAVSKVSLTFGNHYPQNYEFRFRIGGQWVKSTQISGNTEKNRAHVWFTPIKRVQAVRLYGLTYLSGDYFSVYEMAIQR